MGDPTGKGKHCMNGGQPAIRGYLAQTLIALLEALDAKRPWTSVTLEPNVASEKVDILWVSFTASCQNWDCRPAAPNNWTTWWRC